MPSFSPYNLYRRTDAGVMKTTEPTFPTHAITLRRVCPAPRLSNTVELALMVKARVSQPQGHKGVRAGMLAQCLTGSILDWAAQ